MVYALFLSFSYFLDSCSIRYFIYFCSFDCIMLELASSSSLLLILQVLAHWIICLATFFTKVILLLFVHFSSSLPFRSFNCSALRTIVINMNANSKPFFFFIFLKMNLSMKSQNAKSSNQFFMFIEHEKSIANI